MPLSKGNSVLIDITDIHARIPATMQDLTQWVLWKSIVRKGKTTKIPWSVFNAPASSTGPETWAAFDTVVEKYDTNRHAGIGFVFTLDDPFTGIDLDGCRNPQSGMITDWAWKWIKQMNSYTEVSPSGTGVKIFAEIGDQYHKGMKQDLDVERVSDKSPAVEIYSTGRYFAVTGMEIVG